MMLVLNILSDHIISDVSNATAEISTGPKMPTPILLSQVMKFI